VSVRLASYQALGGQQSLARALGLYLRAYQLQAALGWGIRLLGLGLGLDVTALAATRFWPSAALPGWTLALPPIVGIATGAILGLARRPRLSWLAGEVDRRLGLHERTITALELSGRPSNRLAQEQLVDSIQHLRQSEPMEAFPFRAPRRELAAVVGLALLLVPLVLVGPISRSAPAGPRVDLLARGEAERIEALADEIGRDVALEDSPEANAQVAQLLREVAESMQDAVTDADRAMAQLGGAERRLGEMQSPRAFEAAAALSRIADALDRDVRTRPVAAALDRRDYRRAAEEMRQTASRAALSSAADRQAISQALRQASAAAQRYDQRLSEALREAAERSQSGDPSATESAAREVSRAGGEMRRQETLERAMSQLQNSRQALGQGGSRQPGSQSGTNRRPGDSASDREGQGQGGQGQGQPGQGRGPGEGQGSPGRGEGEGDRPGSGAGTGSRALTSELYDPAAVRTRQLRVPGGDFDRPEISEGDSASDSAEGEARVDYRDVLPSYQERATRAMQDRYIPLGMKELVKEYFSSLQPGR